MLEAVGIEKQFYGARGRMLTALDGVCLCAQAGEVLGILGPNGAGKTTLLRILGGIVAPTAGRVMLDGEEVLVSRDSVRRKIGYLSGSTRLYGRLTGREVLRYFGALHGMSRPLMEERISFLTGILDMSGFLLQRCETMSTGQLQKVSISRVLMHDPLLLILDEPTLGLDIISSGAILSLIGNARDRGRIVLFATHSMSEAERLCDRVALIHRGRIPAIDAPARLCEQTGALDLRRAFLKLVGAEDMSFRLFERECPGGPLLPDGEAE